MIKLIDPVKNRYRANLHCHSTLSDGALTPEELKRLYRENGYSVLAITDHEVPYDHSAMSEPDFLMLTGYEAYIRNNDRGAYDLYTPEIHLNLFARDPHNEREIGYDPVYFRYLSKLRDTERMERIGPEGGRRTTAEYVNAFIAEARRQGYIVSYNHPYWSQQDEADIYSYEGCFSFEIFNYSSQTLSGIEYSAGLYDRMLRRGKRLFCHAADDNHNKYPFGHPKNDSCGGATVILADELSYDSVFSALEKGDFYATRGPEIRSLSVEDHRVRIECSPAARVVAYCGSKSPSSVIAPRRETVETVELELDPRALYLRVSVFDAEGNTADTRAYFPDELGWV